MLLLLCLLVRSSCEHLLVQAGCERTELQLSIRDAWHEARVLVQQQGQMHHELRQTMLTHYSSTGEDVHVHIVLSVFDETYQCRLRSCNMWLC
jgi:hypothetical protein